MKDSYVVLTLLWLVFCLLHSILANEKLKTKAGKWQLFSTIPYRIFYNIFAFVSLTAVLVYHRSVSPVFIFQPGISFRIAGIIVSATGLIIMLICIKKYFRQLSGLEDSFTDKLQVSGIHTVIRHPLYAGTFLFIIGLFIILPQWKNLIALTIIILYTLMGIVFEERKLIKHFGQQYIDYKTKVPALFPFIKKADEP